ncbi:MAG: peptidylprolyl isomerase [Deltaproteobacteria bacterium]|nr:peptidylprolyl isomerase [Deltaproteobacteria bacterium]MBW2536015.1 peptidylprolyl isomerase [Deltaproteobacteria bacterium]
MLLSFAVAACDSGGQAGAADTSKPAKAKTAKPGPKGDTKTAAAPQAGPQKPVAAELLDPSLSKDKAPDKFQVKFTTTKGDFVVEVVREWAPNGADRFYNLVKIGYFEDIALFRAVKNFMVQFGIHGDPRVAAKWQNANIAADEPKQSNTRGMLTYAMAGRPDTRSTQLFISYKDNSFLDKQGFAPIGKVVEGMEVVDKFHQGYGEKTTSEQGNITKKGNAFLREKYPELDYIKSVKLVGDAAADTDVEVGPDGVKVKTGDTEVKDGKVKTGNVEVDKGKVKAGGVEVTPGGGVKVPGL